MDFYPTCTILNF